MKIIPSKISNSDNIKIPDFKVHYRAAIRKHHGTSTKTNMETNRIEDPKIKSHSNSYLN
jgi:hypothetical protein